MRVSILVSRATFCTQATAVLLPEIDLAPLLGRRTDKTTMTAEFKQEFLGRKHFLVFKCFSYYTLR
jgi:hypothetical protein